MSPHSHVRRISRSKLETRSKTLASVSLVLTDTLQDKKEKKEEKEEKKTFTETI